MFSISACMISCLICIVRGHRCNKYPSVLIHDIKLTARDYFCIRKYQYQSNHVNQPIIIITAWCGFIRGHPCLRGITGTICPSCDHRSLHQLLVGRRPALRRCHPPLDRLAIPADRCHQRGWHRLSFYGEGSARAVSACTHSLGRRLGCALHNLGTCRRMVCPGLRCFFMEQRVRRFWLCPAGNPRPNSMGYRRDMGASRGGITQGIRQQTCVSKLFP